MSRAVSMGVRQEETQWTCKERAGEMNNKSDELKLVMWGGGVKPRYVWSRLQCRSIYLLLSRHTGSDLSAVLITYYYYIINISSYNNMANRNLE